jgi:hypothetical protein
MRCVLGGQGRRLLRGFAGDGVFCSIGSILARISGQDETGGLLGFLFFTRRDMVRAVADVRLQLGQVATGHFTHFYRL